jgi:hypothetical protein
MKVGTEAVPPLSVPTFIRCCVQVAATVDAGSLFQSPIARFSLSKAMPTKMIFLPLAW